jgi:Ca2+-transporting ATPase
VLGAYAWAFAHLPEPQARAFVFSTLVVGNLALIFSNRSGSGALWRSLQVPNRTLWGVSGLTLGFLGLALFAPWLAQLFYFAPLAPRHLLASLGLGLLSVFWFEAIKWRQRQAR